MEGYKYETHLHTYPASKCGKAGVRESLEFYKEAGFDGVFVTNHFVDGNINYDHTAPYREQLEFYLKDFYEAEEIGKEIGLKVFFGVEMSETFDTNIGWGGTDFLIYGPDPDWYRNHPEIMNMKKSEELVYLRDAGALVIHAHPYREANYIDHIRLYPPQVEGIEVYNGCRTELENGMALAFAESYGKLMIGGTDNHRAGKQPTLGGVITEKPLESVDDFVRAVRSREAKVLRMKNPLTGE